MCEPCQHHNGGGGGGGRREMRKTRPSHYRNGALRSVNDEQLCLTIRQTEEQLLITIREVNRNRLKLALKTALMILLFVWLIVYIFQINQLLIHLISFLLVAFACIQFCTRVVEESLLVIRKENDVIYSYKYLFGITKTQLIPSKEIIINEGIIYNRVIYYMGILLDKSNSDQEDEKIVPIFCKHLPRLDCLKIVYTYLHKFNHC